MPKTTGWLYRALSYNYSRQVWSSSLLVGVPKKIEWYDIPLQYWWWSTCLTPPIIHPCTNSDTYLESTSFYHFLEKLILIRCSNTFLSENIGIPMAHRPPLGASRKSARLARCSSESSISLASPAIHSYKQTLSSIIYIDLSLLMTIDLYQELSTDFTIDHLKW